MKKANPTIHSRYGLAGRSGERINCDISSGENPLSAYEIEPTVGDHRLLLECRVVFDATLPESGIRISQLTAITANVENPFVID